METLIINALVIILTSLLPIIGFLIGIYFAVTKSDSKKRKRGDYKLEDQREIN